MSKYTLRQTIERDKDKDNLILYIYKEKNQIADVNGFFLLLIIQKTTNFDLFIAVFMLQAYHQNNIKFYSKSF